MDGGVQVEALGDLLIVTEPETDFVAIYHPPLVRSILVFCLRAALAALPPPIWLSCSSLTCSSSACVFSSLASFWPRSASRPVRRTLPDNFCLIFIGQTPQGATDWRSPAAWMQSPGLLRAEAHGPNDRGPADRACYAFHRRGCLG